MEAVTMPNPIAGTIVFTAAAPSLDRYRRPSCPGHRLIAAI
jgi:hypothetical protein